MELDVAVREELSLVELDWLGSFSQARHSKGLIKQMYLKYDYPSTKEVLMPVFVYEGKKYEISVTELERYVVKEESEPAVRSVQPVAEDKLEDAELDAIVGGSRCPTSRPPRDG